MNKPRAGETRSMCWWYVHYLGAKRAKNTKALKWPPSLVLLPDFLEARRDCQCLRGRAAESDTDKREEHDTLWAPRLMYRHDLYLGKSVRNFRHPNLGSHVAISLNEMPMPPPEIARLGGLLLV